jgi:hypothetical protein
MTANHRVRPIWSLAAEDEHLETSATGWDGSDGKASDGELGHIGATGERWPADNHGLSRTTILSRVLAQMA